MQVGDTVRVQIETFAPSGNGATTFYGQRLEVPGTTPGDEVTAVIEAVSQHHPVAWAKLGEVHQRGPGFREPACPHAAPLVGACGGCPMLHVDPDAALAAKWEDARASIGTLAPLTTLHPPPATWAYRNRGTWLAMQTTDGVTPAVRAPRTGELVALPSCGVMRPEVWSALTAAFAAWNAHDTEPERLRSITSRTDRTGQVLVEFIVRSGDAPSAACVATTQAAGVAGVFFSRHAYASNSMRAEPPRWLAGARGVSLSYGGVTWQVDTAPFAQLHDAVADQILDRLSTWGAHARVIWDLYGGVGALSLPIAASHGAQVWLAERDEVSVAAARAAASAAGLTLVASAIDLERETPEWPAPDLIIVDPPRRGLSAGVLAQCIAAKAPIAYVSCSPATFARDAKKLRDAGWQAECVEGFDMLPNTTHLELASLWRPPA